MLFRSVHEVPQREETPFHPRSPYACAKVFAYWATVNYREGYGLQGESLGDEMEGCKQADLSPETFEDAVGRAKLEFHAVHNSIA